jgi:hypothetical protein
MDTNAYPDPAIYIMDLQEANKILIFVKKFFCLLLFIPSFFKDKKSKRSHKTVEILIIEGSGSRKPKNT